jgi:hypothetical protein
MLAYLLIKEILLRGEYLPDIRIIAGSNKPDLRGLD